MSGLCFVAFVSMGHAHDYFKNFSQIVRINQKYFNTDGMKNDALIDWDCMTKPKENYPWSHK